MLCGIAAVGSQVAPARLGDICVQIDVCATAKVRPHHLQIVLCLRRRHAVGIVLHVFVEQASYTMTTALMVEHTVNAREHISNIRRVVVHEAYTSSGIIRVIDDADPQRTVGNQILHLLGIGKGILVRSDGLFGAIVQLMVGRHGLHGIDIETVAQ